MKHRICHNWKTVDATLIRSGRSTCMTKPIRLPSLLIFSYCLVHFSPLPTDRNSSTRTLQASAMNEIMKAMHSRGRHSSTLRLFKNRKAAVLLLLFSITEDQTFVCLQFSFSSIDWLAKERRYYELLLNRRWWSSSSHCRDGPQANTLLIKFNQWFYLQGRLSDRMQMTRI